MVEDREAELTQLLSEVRRIEVQARRLVTGVMAGSYNSVFRGSGIEFDEVREYEPGDDPRSVDWNVTARIGKPYIKRYVEERAVTVLFLVDLSSTMNGGLGVWSMRQMAARVCACLALAAVENNDHVGLVAMGRGIEKYVPPDKGSAQALRVVRDCLALPSSPGPVDMVPAMRFAARAVRRHSVLFVLSDFLSTGWERELMMCSRRHDVTAVRFMPPELAGVPAGGLVRVRDPQTGDETVIDWSSRRVREAYAERMSAWKERTQRLMRRAQVDLMDVPVPVERDRDAVARPILRFFKMREQRGAKR